VSNFGTAIFMRSREEEVDLFAATHLGTRVQTKMIETSVDEGGLMSHGRGKIRQCVLVCPFGTLGHLESHQAFVASPGHPPYEHPLSFVPWYEGCKSKSPEELYSLVHLQRLLSKHGFREVNDDPTFRAALVLCSEESHHRRVLAETKEFFLIKRALVPRGLERLPTAWLKALPHILWSLRQAPWTHLPFMINETNGADGLLQVRFEQESQCPAETDRVTVWDWIRLKLNASLYPSRWRPLNSKHQRYLKVRRPDLPPPGAPTLT
jgi:hypothetical protein